VQAFIIYGRKQRQKRKIHNMIRCYSEKFADLGNTGGAALFFMHTGPLVDNGQLLALYQFRL
jgi:hypothetical protein